jgi:hypothetical protein
LNFAHLFRKDVFIEFYSEGGEKRRAVEVFYRNEIDLWKVVDFALPLAKALCR